MLVDDDSIVLKENRFMIYDHYHYEQSIMVDEGESMRISASHRLQLHPILLSLVALTHPPGPNGTGLVLWGMGQDI